ncbi:MAG TPA: hypothetical protein K8V94_02340 [Corynebacterium amycolatum]|uniref:hypothetical protein n=1 Tax=Corynebacterium variabile TaxID=1727 RepID=UPI001D3E9D32|nr:hypothetical protein [Corynebacterium amycolatum]
MNFFKFFDKDRRHRDNARPDSTAPADENLISLDCEECGNATFNEIGPRTDGDHDNPLPTIEYKCTRCGHLVWGSEDEFRRNLKH